MITSELILNILLILIVAWILGSVFTRFGLPVMLGELLARIILGPPLSGLANCDQKTKKKDLGKLTQVLDFTLVGAKGFEPLTPTVSG